MCPFGRSTIFYWEFFMSCIVEAHNICFDVEGARGSRRMTNKNDFFREKFIAIFI